MLALSSPLRVKGYAYYTPLRGDGCTTGTPSGPSGKGCSYWRHPLGGRGTSSRATVMATSEEELWQGWEP
jgi:hypothetical protein